MLNTVRRLCFQIAINLSKYINVTVSEGTAYGLLATRILLGISQAPIYSCLSAIAAAWYPADQRGGLCSIGFIGIAVRIGELYLPDRN